MAERAVGKAGEPVDVIARHLPEPSSAPSSVRGRQRVLAVAALTVALAAVVAAVQQSVAASVLRGLLVVVLIPCAAIDLERRIIPNRITRPAALVAIAVGSALAPGSELGRVLAGAAAGGFLFIASLARPSGMGMGDVKLVGVMGLFLGAPVAIGLFVALIASVLSGVALATQRGVHTARKTAVPFGPYLALGGLVAALVGDHLVHVYLSLHH